MHRLRFHGGRERIRATPTISWHCSTPTVRLDSDRRPKEERILNGEHQSVFDCLIIDGLPFQLSQNFSAKKWFGSKTVAPTLPWPVPHRLIITAAATQGELNLQRQCAGEWRSRRGGASLRLADAAQVYNNVGSLAIDGHIQCTAAMAIY